MNLPRASVRNPVAVHLFMWVLIGAGVYYAFNLTREMFPNSSPEQILVAVPYPGATPEEVEKAVTRRIEREIDDVADVEKIESSVLEGVSRTIITVEDGADPAVVLNDIRGEVDRVKPELPQDTEDPEVTLVRPFFPAIAVIVHGDVSERRLHEAARRVRDDMLDIAGVSLVAATGMRDREIWIEVHPRELEEYGLTFDEVGRTVSSGNLDLPGGQIKGRGGNVGVRTVGEEDDVRDIETLILRGGRDGTAVRLMDVAKVKDTFEDVVEFGRFAGKPAVQLTVFKTPEQDAVDISQAVKDYVAKNDGMFEGAVSMSTTLDLSRFVEQRIDLMLRNAKWGIILVLITLAIFLDLRVAFWVGIGLPISFLGTFVAMYFLGATINLISLFGLIVVLGLIVDDAIVIGENVFRKMRQKKSALDAADEGTNEVAVPVVAAVLTTIVAFMPLAFIDGDVGTFLRQLPLVVIAALSVSLIEAFIILPCHLGHRGDRKGVRIPIFSAVFGAVGRAKHHFFETTLPNAYEKLIRVVLRWRYVVLSGTVAASMIAVGLMAGGVVPFVFLQDTDAESISIDLEMVSGVTEDQTIAAVKRIESVALQLPETLNCVSVVGAAFGDRGRITAADPATVGQVNLELVAAETRQAEGQRSSQQVLADLRRDIGKIPGAAKLVLRARSGGPGGPDIELRVRATDLDTLQRTVDHVKEQLRSYEGVVDIEDNFKRGKLEVRLRLREEARSLGLSTRDLARQVRNAFFGVEAQKLQGEDEEITVRVVLPKTSRADLADLGHLRVALPSGARVPLGEVAELGTGRGYSTLARLDGQRAVTVTAKVEQEKANLREITNSLTQRFDDIDEQFPGASLAFAGRRRETSASVGSLRVGFPVALFLIYSIIAILFRSYLQPFIVMIAIPFAVLGAVVGHFIAGYPFTLLSMIGSVALSGIVVNDSLILVDFINRRRRDGRPLTEAIIQGGRERLRPILLTSITTISGLAPLVLEKSFQAQFLIPMAVSIVYGLAFATVLILVLLPCLYQILEDLRFRRRRCVEMPQETDLPQIA